CRICARTRWAREIRPRYARPMDRPGIDAQHLDLRHQLLSHSEWLDAADHDQYKSDNRLGGHGKRSFRSAREATGITPRSVNTAAPPREPAAVTKSPESRRRAAIIALFAGAIGIGFAPILVRLSQVGPSATAAF